MNRIRFGAFAAVVGCMFVMAHVAVAVEYTSETKDNVLLPNKPPDRVSPPEDPAVDKPTAPSNSDMETLVSPTEPTNIPAQHINAPTSNYGADSGSNSYPGQRIVYNGQVFQWQQVSSSPDRYGWRTLGAASSISIDGTGNINAQENIRNSTDNYALLNGGKIIGEWSMFRAPTTTDPTGTHTTGVNNTLHLVHGELSGIVHVGQGLIYINEDLTGLTITGEITTNSTHDPFNTDPLADYSSTWVMTNGTIAGGKLSSNGDIGDTYYIGGSAADSVRLTDDGMGGAGELNVRSGSTIYIGYGNDDNFGENFLHANIENFVITASGSGNVINMFGDVNVSDEAVINLGNPIGGNKNQLNLLLDHKDFDGAINVNGTETALYIGRDTIMTTDSQLTVNADKLIEIITDQAIFKADWEIEKNSHVLFIDEDATYEGWKKYTGNDVSVVVELNSGVEMTGQVVFETDPLVGNVSNTVFISGDGIHENWNGSFIGSNTVATNVIVDGGKTSLVVSGGARTDYIIENDAELYNIRARDGAAALTQGGNQDYAAVYVAKDLLTGITHTATFQGTGQEYQSYSLLNLNELEMVGKNNLLSIGYMKRRDRSDDAFTNQDEFDELYNPAYSSGRTDTDLGNQITANTVTIWGTNKLVIHEDERLTGLSTTWLETNVIGDEVNRNVINKLEIKSGGHVTIDRTTIHGTNDGDAVIQVARGGILAGFGEIDKGNNNNDPLRAQVVGNVELAVGAVLMPYDGAYWNAHNPYPDSYKDYASGGYETDFKGPTPYTNYTQFVCDDEDLRGVTFEVSKGINTNDGGTLFFNKAVELRTRLFHDDDIGRRDVQILGDYSEGDPRVTQLADAWKTEFADFTSVWNGTDNWSGYLDANAQAQKIQYTPVFGYHYDLESKLKYIIYSGTEYDSITNPDSMTYRFRVLESAQEIDGFYYNHDTTDVRLTDANHLFNRLILRSDMLGNYMFMQTADGKGVYLRYRMIANHPVNGGIKSVITSSNNMVTSQYLDEIRYPFKNWDTDLQHLDNDDSWGMGTTTGGFNGDIVEWYAQPGNNKYFDNYTDAYMRDWDRLLHGMQLHVESSDEMDDAMSQLNSGVYATASDANLNTMNEFIHNRERNSISALFGVESDQEEASGSAFANLNASNGYVSNPIRFWASGFGRLGKQRTNSRAMGYDTDVWGGAVGVVKEYCDTYFGLTIGHARSSHKWDNMPTNFKSKSYIGEVHAGARIFDLGFIEVHGNYSYNEQETSRGINYANYYIANYKADWVDHVYGGGIRLGYQKPFAGKWLFVPTLGVTVMHNRSQEFAEESRGPNGLSPRLVFKKGAMDRTVVRTPVMMRLSRSWAICDFLVSPEIRAGFTPIMGQRSGRSVAKWAGNPTDNRYFTSRSGGKGAYEAIFGATLEVSRKGRFYAAGNYDYEYSPNAFAHSFSIQAGMNF